MSVHHVIKTGLAQSVATKTPNLADCIGVGISLFLSLLTRSFQEGSYNANIDNAARFYTGLIQLQHPEYAESSSIDDVIAGDLEQFPYLKNMNSVSYILPRLESVALAALMTALKVCWF